MKKLLSKTLVAATVVASVFSTFLPMAYAAETQELVTPTITLNGEPADVRAKIINDKVYFSIRDFWVNIDRRAPESIKWYPEQRTVSDGYNFIRLDEQTVYIDSVGVIPLEDPALLIDGTTYMAASFLDSHSTSFHTDYELTDTGIHFRNLIWEQKGVDMKRHFSVPVIPVDEELGYPNFESFVLAYNYGFRNKNVTVTKTELEDGKTLFTYVSKDNPEKTLTATVQHGYVSHVADNGLINLYRPR